MTISCKPNSLASSERPTQASQRKGQRHGGNQKGWLRAVEPMLKQNWGRIIFISSESELQIPTKMIHYGMSKTA